MSPNDLATHNNAAKFKICLLIQITVKRCQVRLLNIKIWEMYKKVLSSGKIVTVRLNMSKTARNNIHSYPIGYANSYCFNPLSYLNLCVLRVGITWQRYNQNIYVSNAFVSSNKNYIFKTLLWKYACKTIVFISFKII
jgi:hypothetical protein